VSTGIANPTPAYPPDGLDGGIGLDHVADGHAAGRLNLASEGGDDAGGQRLVETERIADREHRLADLEVSGIADHDGRQKVGWSVDMEYGKVLFPRETDQLCLPGAAVGEGDLGTVRVLDDVVVGNDVATRVPDKAGARTAGNLHHVEAKEVPPERNRGDIDDRR
jgi:hypothetical protein